MGLSEWVSYTVILFYALGSTFAFAAMFAGDKARLRLFSGVVTLAGFALHSGLTLQMIMMGGTDSLTKGDYLQILSWSVILVCCLSWRFLRLAALGLTLPPLALFLYIASLGVGSIEGGAPSMWTPLFSLLHMGALFLSFSLIALGAVAAIIFLRMEKQLKDKAALMDFDSDLPALSTFDAVNKWVTFLSFPLYTLGLFSGFAWARSEWGAAVSWDPKEVVSLIIWLLIALLFHQRMALGWQGRKAATLMLAIFALSLFSIIGINFFMTSHHSFFQAGS